MISLFKEELYIPDNGNSRMIYFVDEKYCTDFVSYKLNLETFELQDFNYVGYLDSYRTGTNSIAQVNQMVKTDNLDTYDTTLPGNLSVISDNILDFKWYGKLLVLSNTGNFFLVTTDGEGNCIHIEDLDICVFRYGFVNSHFARMIHIHSDLNGMFIVAWNTCFYLDIINRKIMLIENAANFKLANMMSLQVSTHYGKAYTYTNLTTYPIYELDFLTLKVKMIQNNTANLRPLNLSFNRPHNELKYGENILQINGINRRYLTSVESNQITWFRLGSISDSNSELIKFVYNINTGITNTINILLCERYSLRYNENKPVYTITESFKINEQNALIYDLNDSLYISTMQTLYHFVKIWENIFQLEYSVPMGYDIKGAFLPEYETAIVYNNVVYLQPETRYVAKGQLGDYNLKHLFVAYQKDVSLISIDPTNMRFLKYFNVDNRSNYSDRIKFTTHRELDDQPSTRLVIEAHADAYLFDGLVKRYKLNITSTKTPPKGEFRYFTIIAKHSVEDFIIGYKRIQTATMIDIVIGQEDDGSGNLVDVEQTISYIQIKTYKKILDVSVVMQMIKAKGYDIIVAEVPLLEYLETEGIKISEQYDQTVLDSKYSKENSIKLPELDDVDDETLDNNDVYDPDEEEDDTFIFDDIT